MAVSLLVDLQKKDDLALDEDRREELNERGVKSFIGTHDLSGKIGEFPEN